MMDNEADMIILFMSNENESFTSLKFGQILIWQNQKQQIHFFHGLESFRCTID